MRYVLVSVLLENIVIFDVYVYIYFIIMLFL